MNTLMIVNLSILVCATLGALSGTRYLRSRKNLYASMIVLGVVCLALGRLYQCARLWTGGSLTERFQPGILGIMGAFSFFFSANFGQIDSLVDGGEGCFAKYRIIALAGPLCVAAMLIPVVLSPAGLAFRICCVVVSGVIGVASYFHVKHLLIPDVDYGVVRCLRGYNALALALSVLSMLEMIALAWSGEGLLYAAGAGLCVVTAALVPVMDRGVKKWIT